MKGSIEGGTDRRPVYRDPSVGPGTSEVRPPDRTRDPRPDHRYVILAIRAVEERHPRNGSGDGTSRRGSGFCRPLPRESDTPGLVDESGGGETTNRRLRTYRFREDSPPEVSRGLRSFRVRIGPTDGKMEGRRTRGLAHLTTEGNDPMSVYRFMHLSSTLEGLERFEDHGLPEG